jgi:hypothetical protein
MHHILWVSTQPRFRVLAVKWTPHHEAPFSPPTPSSPDNIAYLAAPLCLDRQATTAFAGEWGIASARRLLNTLDTGTVRC